MARACSFILLLVILFAFGCGESVEEKAMEKKIEESSGGKANVDLTEKGMNITGETEKGKYSFSSGESIEIPKEFPADVLVYRPSKAVMAMKMPEGHSVSLITTHDATEVKNAYQQQMKAKGWSEETSMNMNAQAVLMYKKEDRVVNIVIAKADDGTQVSVTVSTD